MPDNKYIIDKRFQTRVSRSDRILEVDRVVRHWSG